MQRHVAKALLISVALGIPGLGAQAVPGRARETPAAEIAEPVPPSFDHSAFDALLRAHVKDGLVDYRAFAANAKFTAYLASLQAAKLEGLEEAERISFWVNVYNAYTIHLVSSSGETESIRNIEKAFGLFKLKGPWSKPFVQAAGRTLSLDEVQHRILRHDFSEPRVHFAISYAARGGPRLRNEAYTGLQLDEQLEDQARTFLHDTVKNRVDTARTTVFISPIIGSYRADFGESTTALGRFLADYYPDGPQKRFLLPPKRPDVSRAIARRDADTTRRADGTRGPPQRPPERWFRVRETPFDWTLNIQRPVAKGG